MKKFEILPHKADVRIKLFGKNKKELFLNALLAMAEIQKGKILGKKTEKRVKVKSVDLNSLLVDFLNEILYLTQVEKEVYKGVNFKKFSDKEIECVIFGRKVKGFGKDIKAVTYHNLQVEKKKGNIWQAVIIFDI